VDLEGDLFHVVPGPVLGREGHARLLEGVDVQEEGVAVGSQAEGVELAVQLARVDDAGRHVGEVQDLLLDEGIQRLQEAAALPFGDSLVVLLHHVRELSARGHGGHLGPVVVPAGEFVGDGHVRVELLVELDDLDGVLVADLGAPPGDLELGLLGGGRRGVALAAGEGDRRGERDYGCDNDTFHERNPPCLG
jgi:hypothetical protein